MSNEGDKMNDYFTCVKCDEDLPLCEEVQVDRKFYINGMSIPYVDSYCKVCVEEIGVI